MAACGSTVSTVRSRGTSPDCGLGEDGDHLLRGAPPLSLPKGRAPLARLGNSRPWLRFVLIGCLTFALSGWTCSAIVGFQTCLGVSQAPQITSLSPNAISANATSVLLIVIGNNFDPQSQILWNGNTLATTFIDSQHLQATITQQTFTQLGGSFRQQCADFREFPGSRGMPNPRQLRHPGTGD